MFGGDLEGVLEGWRFPFNPRLNVSVQNPLQIIGAPLQTPLQTFEPPSKAFLDRCLEWIWRGLAKGFGGGLPKIWRGDWRGRRRVWRPRAGASREGKGTRTQGHKASADGAHGSMGPQGEQKYPQINFLRKKQFFNEFQHFFN